MILFYGEEMLAPRPTTKLEDHPLSAVRDRLLNVFAATLHISGRSSIHNLRMRHVLATGTQLSWTFGYAIFLILCEIDIIKTRCFFLLFQPLVFATLTAVHVNSTLYI